jgi:hypothetical protein
MVCEEDGALVILANERGTCKDKAHIREELAHVFHDLAGVAAGHGLRFGGRQGRGFSPI